MKLVTEPILKQVENFWAILAKRINLDNAGNSEAAGLRRDDAPRTSSDNRCDTANVFLNQTGKLKISKTPLSTKIFNVTGNSAYVGFSVGWYLSEWELLFSVLGCTLFERI